MYFVTDNEIQAAVTIQSLWRGYHARHKHPDVVRVWHEIRSKRSEDHIRDLHQQLDRYYHIIFHNFTKVYILCYIVFVCMLMSWFAFARP